MSNVEPVYSSAALQGYADPQWLEVALRRFTDLRDQQRLPHAILVQGAKGWGVPALALACAAQLLNRAVPSILGSDSLLDVADPQLTVIQRELNDRGEKYTQIRINQIRDLNSFVYRATTGVRCVVMLEAELMNHAAANALLKTLEEPPANVVLILAAEEPGRLLPTIRSRTQVLPLQQASALPWLLAHLPAEYRDDAPVLLDLCGGAPLAVPALLENGSSIQDIQEMFNSLAMARTPADLVPLVSNLSEKGTDTRAYIGWWARAFRQLLWDHDLNAQNSELVSDTLKRLPKGFASEAFRQRVHCVPMSKLITFVRQLERALRLLATPVNKKLLMEELMFGWCELLGEC